MPLDGVVLPMPPASTVERFNYAWGGATHMWRKPGEANSPRLAGNGDYDKQAPFVARHPGVGWVLCRRIRGGLVA